MPSSRLGLLAVLLASAALLASAKPEDQLPGEHPLFSVPAPWLQQSSKASGRRLPPQVRQMLLAASSVSPQRLPEQLGTAGCSEHLLVPVLHAETPWSPRRVWS